MQILKSRPLATAALVAMLIAVAAFFLPIYGKLLVLLLVLLLLISAVILLSVGKRTNFGIIQTIRITLVLTMITVCLTTLTSAYHFHIQTQIPEGIADNETYHNIECTVIEEGSAGTGYSYYTVSLKAIDGQKTSGKAVLRCEYVSSAHLGDALCVQTTIQSPTVFYEPDEITYAIADGISICLISDRAEELQINKHNAMPLRQLLANWRANLSARLRSMTGKQCGGLATALFLGDRDGLDARISTNFRRTGVSHLLALSGLHVTLLMGMVAALTTRLGIPKRGKLLLLAALSLAYLALIGFRLSAVRATGMLLLFYFSEFLGTRRDPLTTLCVIGWGILTVSPSAVADGGFWMSFAAVFGLVTALPELNKWLDSKNISKKMRYICQAIAASAIAVTSVAYLSWLFCGEIAPIGILLTALLSPILTWILTMIPIVLFVDLLPFFSAVPFIPMLSVPLELMLHLTNQISQWRHITFSLQIPLAGMLLGTMTTVVLVMMIIPLRKKLFLLLPPVLTVICMVISMQLWNHIRFDDHLQASYVVRSSGSTLAISDHEGTAVIDTSSGSYSMLKDTAKAIREQGITEIEHLILTHYHRSHIYSTERLAKRQLIRYLWVPTPQSEADYFHLCALRDRMTPLGTEVRCYKLDEPLELFGDAVFQLVDASYIERSSQPILTYMLQTPHEILTYSSPVVQESDYYPTFRWICERTDILILGKHGPTIRQEIDLPLQENTPYLILTDSTSILPYLDLSTQSKIYEIPMITDIRCYKFNIPK